MPDLTETERGQIIGLFKSGATKTSTVIRTIQNFLERKTNHTVAARTFKF